MEVILLSKALPLKLFMLDTIGLTLCKDAREYINGCDNVNDWAMLLTSMKCLYSHKFRWNHLIDGAWLLWDQLTPSKGGGGG